MLVFGSTKRLPTGGSCISNALRTGRVIRYMTQITHEKIFFNRKRELDLFNSAFNASPRLHVVLGPPMVQVIYTRQSREMFQFCN